MSKKWNDRQLKEFYKKTYPASDFLTSLHKEFFYPFVRSLGELESGFEFGCNKGKNLYNLGFEKTGGIDISQRAINEAMVEGLLCGDERMLKAISANSYDIVLTCSVLNHIEDIGDIVKNLERIAKKHVLFVESQDDTHANHFPHDYEAMGYEKVFESKPTPKGIIYNGYYSKID